MSDVAISDWPERPGYRHGASAISCPRQRLVELAAGLSRTIAMARGLIRGGRHLDVTGIDESVGVLCAQTLDLAPEDASAMVPVLQGVLTQVDLLAAALRKPGGGSHFP